MAAKKKEEKPSYTGEMIIWLIAAVMLILELGNFGLCGFVNYISQFFFGMFGFLEYGLPIIVMGCAFFLHVNSYQKRAVQKVVLLASLLLCIGIVCQMGIQVDEIKDMFLYSFKNKQGGGIVCGGLAFLFNKLLGRIGTYIVLVFAFIIGVVFLLEISVIDALKSLFVFTYSKNEEPERPVKKREKKEIVREDYPKSEMPRRKKSSLMEQLTVLPADTDQGIIKSEPPKTVPEEEVHEITMTYPVPLPGEAMDFTSDNNEKVRKPRSKKNAVSVDNSMENVIEKKERKSKKTTANKSNESKTLPEALPKTLRETTLDDSGYQFPPRELLKTTKSQTQNNDSRMQQNAQQLKDVLESFGVGVTMQNYSCGPSVTRYEMIPDQGVKVSKITGLADDLMMNLAAQSIRIEAPIPGKRAVGIEIPNEKRSGVGFRELIDSEQFLNYPSKIAFAVGKDIEGNVIVEDIAKMPHLLIAGATGSGKSVCTNTLIMSILYKARPDEVKLILVDPKQVELKVYNGIPHLLTPVVTDPKKAAGALNWAVGEMTKRYQLFSECNVRNIQGYNAKVKEIESDESVLEVHLKPMPQIVIIVDELADLMMVAKSEVEEAIVRLAQLARAAGIHLVIATQRPSVDVVTGLIKANVPSRIALSVSSGVDSRTIIDSVGAEKLLGNGDMLFYPTNYPKPLRVQGAYISDDEVVRVVDYLIEHNKKEEEAEDISGQFVTTDSGAGPVNTGNGVVEDGRDEYFVQAGKFIIEKDKASIGMLQRMFKIGFNRAARIMDQLHTAGVVGPEEGTKPRQVLMTLEEFETYMDSESGSDEAIF